MQVPPFWHGDCAHVTTVDVDDVLVNSAVVLDVVVVFVVVTFVVDVDVDVVVVGPISQLSPLYPAAQLQLYALGRLWMAGHVCATHVAVATNRLRPRSVLVLWHSIKQDVSHWLLPSCSVMSRQYMEAAQSLLVAQAAD